MRRCRAVILKGRVQGFTIALQPEAELATLATTVAKTTYSEGMEVLFFAFLSGVADGHDLCYTDGETQVPENQLTYKVLKNLGPIFGLL